MVSSFSEVCVQQRLNFSRGRRNSTWKYGIIWEIGEIVCTSRCWFEQWTCPRDSAEKFVFSLGQLFKCCTGYFDRHIVGFAFGICFINKHLVPRERIVILRFCFIRKSFQEGLMLFSSVCAKLCEFFNHLLQFQCKPLGA